MSTRAKVMVTIGVAAVAIGLAVYMFHQQGDTPIEVADGSVKLHFSPKFVRKGNKQLVAKIPGHKAQRIEVLDTGANNPFCTIDVTGREWTIQSANKTLTISKLFPQPDPNADEILITSSSVDLQQGSSEESYEQDDRGKFTPASLTFTRNGSSIPLFCLSGNCTVRICLKK